MREHARAPGEARRERTRATDNAEPSLRGGLSALQASIGNAALGRMLGARRRTTGEPSLPVTCATQAAIQAERGLGVPLGSELRGHMESLVGADLEGVRVHGDRRSDALSARLGARAFTQGSDVFLGSRAGPETLVHELQHVAEGAPAAGAVVRDADGIDRDEAGWELGQSLSAPQPQAQVAVHAGSGPSAPAPTIPDPNAPPPPAKMPQTFDISLVLDNIPKTFAGLTADKAMTELGAQVRHLRGLVDVYRSWHQALIQNREDHPIVGFWADKFGGHGDPPDIDMWNLVGREELWRAQDVIGAGEAKLGADFDARFAEQQARVQAIREQGGPNLNNFAGVRGVEDARESAHDDFIADHVRSAADLVQRAANVIEIRRKRVFYYKEGSIKGAERGIAGTKVAIDVLVTTASAGVGEVVEGGIAVKAVATGITQGGLTMYSEGATQTGEMFYGDREWGNFDVDAIKRAGKRAAVNGFIGALAAGKLTKLIDAKVARYVAPVLEDAGINLDNAGLQFVAKGTRDWVVGQITSPVNTVANTVMDVAIDGKQPPSSWGEFYDRVADDFKQSGAMGGVMVVLAHGVQAAHGAPAVEAPGTRSPREPNVAPTDPGQPTPAAEPAPAAGTGAPEPVPPRAGGTRAPATVEEIVHLMPSETVMQPADPRDVSGAQVMYENSVVGEPGGPVREAAMYRNTATGEVIVIQGEVDIVQVAPGEAPAPGGKAQRWKEILDGRPDIGNWELLAHSHPPVYDPLTGAELPHTRLPSGASGDMGTLVAEALASGQARSSRLDYFAGGRLEHTTFGIDPASQRPVWIEYIDPVTGIRQPRTFASLEEYHTFLREQGIDPGPMPDAIRTALPPRATKVGVSDELLSGEGIAKQPETVEELAQSNDEVAAASGTLRAGRAPLEAREQAIVAIAERTVVEYRATRAREWARLHNVPASEVRMTGETLRGCCGQGRDLTSESIASLTIDSAVPVTIDRYQVADLGIDELHGFAIVREGDGAPHLIDATYAQFPGDPLTGAAARAEQATDPGRVSVSNDLLRSGVIPLDEATARNYLLNVGATPEVASSMARELMAGRGAVLREIVQRGRISRRVPGENVPEDLREAYEGPDEHGLIAQVEEMLALAPAGTPDHALLVDLRNRLMRISRIARPVRPHSIR